MMTRVSDIVEALCLALVLCVAIHSCRKVSESAGRRAVWEQAIEALENNPDLGDSLSGLLKEVPEDEN